jgi:hypothetical protein
MKQEETIATKNLGARLTTLLGQPWRSGGRTLALDGSHPETSRTFSLTVSWNASRALALWTLLLVPLALSACTRVEIRHGHQLIVALESIGDVKRSWERKTLLRG